MLFILKHFHYNGESNFISNNLSIFMMIILFKYTLEITD